MSRKSFAALFERARRHPEFHHEKIALRFLGRVERLMEEKGISRAELARRMGTSAPYVTKVFAGDANFTLETMTRIAAALDAEVHVHVAPRSSDMRWVEVARPRSRRKDADIIRADFRSVRMAEEQGNAAGTLAA